LIFPISGYIYVNNLSIESLFINEYRASLGLSLAEETPFEGTIRENITFGNKNISDEEVYQTFKNIGLTDFLKQQTKGLNTILKPEGKQVANTISKKIVLARAIVKQPKLLILEDPLDHFNKEEAGKIISFLTNASQPWSLIVVSSNEGWKQKCNKFIVLKNGKIVNKQ